MKVDYPRPSWIDLPRDDWRTRSIVLPIPCLHTKQTAFLSDGNGYVHKKTDASSIEKPVPRDLVDALACFSRIGTQDRSSVESVKTKAEEDD